jgi:hypothetical protein
MNVLQEPAAYSLMSYLSVLHHCSHHLSVAQFDHVIVMITLLTLTKDWKFWNTVLHILWSQNLHEFGIHNYLVDSQWTLSSLHHWSVTLKLQNFWLFSMLYCRVTLIAPFFALLLLLLLLLLLILLLLLLLHSTFLFLSTIFWYSHVQF